MGLGWIFKKIWNRGTEEALKQIPWETDLLFWNKQAGSAPNELVNPWLPQRLPRPAMTTGTG
jgi:hypothetical protein